MPGGLHRVLCTCSAFPLAWAIQAPVWAADHQFQYAATVRELYSEDVFRTGADGRSDFITGLRVEVGLTSATVRSSAQIQYIPSYLDYATFSDLDHLDHRLQSSWQFTPGRRSQVGLKQAFVISTRQSGLRDLEEDEEAPIVRQTRREGWTLEPFHSIELSRKWRLQTQATLRTLSFNSPELVDSTRLGLEVAATAQVRAAHHLRASLRGDAFRFDEHGAAADSDGRPTRITAAEVSWSLEKPSCLSWNAGTGLYRVSGDGLPAATEPTLHLWLSWGQRKGHLALGYDLSYSTFGGLGGTSRSRAARVTLNRRWGRGLETSMRGSFMSRDPLGAMSAGEGSLDGSRLGVDVAYHWESGLGLLFQHGAVRQESSTARELDYQEISVALSYVPPGRRNAVSRSGS